MPKGCHSISLSPALRSLRVPAEMAECGINVCPAIRLHQHFRAAGKGAFRLIFPLVAPWSAGFSNRIGAAARKGRCSNLSLRMVLSENRFRFFRVMR